VKDEAMRFDGQVIFCADVAASARFYEQGLDLTLDWADDQHIQFRLPTKGDPEGAWLLLHPATDGGNPPQSLGTFVVDDVDGVINRLREAGFTITQEPTDQPWGVREASVDDLDGNGLTLTTPTTAA
jgi:lactoylglutathione lyase